MPKHVLAVFSNPTEDNEAEFNEWYTGQHLDEVLQIPGFVAAQRFKLNDNQLSGFVPSAHRYMALYEIEGDPDEALEELHKRVESGTIALPKSIDAASIGPWSFTPITERMTEE
ncbi:hypothetical protein SAMN06265360_1417 [Haloechinothrix alba]|uniref:EthD domain-containing protein n=1 Tax=Haloechinothrix alba TaxID=664784 RepID=A0A239AI05_9PSEU|nr:DUF4286 family protein [Haloechinothrix alba]SNR94992.1 hypothetical protein SAMN06265360_1417 [Haloechinothrix alba]